MRLLHGVGMEDMEQQRSEMEAKVNELDWTGHVSVLCVSSSSVKVGPF